MEPTEAPLGQTAGGPRGEPARQARGPRLAVSGGLHNWVPQPDPTEPLFLVNHSLSRALQRWTSYHHVTERSATHRPMFALIGAGPTLSGRQYARSRPVRADRGGAPLGSRSLHVKASTRRNTRSLCAAPHNGDDPEVSCQDRPRRSLSRGVESDAARGRSTSDARLPRRAGVVRTGSDVDWQIWIGGGIGRRLDSSVDIVRGFKRVVTLASSAHGTRAMLGARLTESDPAGLLRPWQSQLVPLRS